VRFPQRSDQDTPELIRGHSVLIPTLTFASGGVRKIPNGRILRKQSIPIHVPAQTHGSKQCGHRRRSQDHIAGDIVGGLLIDCVASEDSEFTGIYVRRADQQPRRGGGDADLIEPYDILDQFSEVAARFKTFRYGLSSNTSPRLPNPRSVLITIASSQGSTTAV